MSSLCLTLSVAPYGSRDKTPALQCGLHDPDVGPGSGLTSWYSIPAPAQDFSLGRIFHQEARFLPLSAHPSVLSFHVISSERPS